MVPRSRLVTEGLPSRRATAATAPQAARALYRKYGFKDCGPFGDYRLDPNSIFLSLDL